MDLNERDYWKPNQKKEERKEKRARMNESLTRTNKSRRE